MHDGLNWSDEDVERWRRVSEREDSLRAARGVMVGVALSLVLWLVIVAAILVIV